MRLTDDPSYHNDWYHRNKERLAPARRERNKREHEKRRELVTFEKLKRGRCEICALKVTRTNHVGFDWDHIDPQTKSFAIADGLRRSVRDLLAEIEKCRLLCKICHAILTHQEQHYQLNREPLIEIDNQPSLFEEDNNE
jgi:hypothetical protein